MSETAVALANLEKAGSLTPTRLFLPDTITADQYEAVGHAIGSMRDSLQWAVGDWLVIGERLFEAESSQYSEALGISEVSRLQYIRVALRVSPERRVEGLSWSHHREVAPLDPEDQSEWLQKAQDNHWNKTELSEEIKKVLRGTLPPPPGNRRYVIEAVAEAAEKVWEAAAPSISEPDVYIVPSGPMQDLANALGEAK